MVKKNAMIHKLLAALLCACLVLGSFGGITVAAAADYQYDPNRNDVVAVLNPGPITTSPSQYMDTAISTDQVTLLVGNSSNLRTVTDPTDPITLKTVLDNYWDQYLIGVAADFCVFVRNDFTVTDSDAEGRVAVGGNFNINTAWNNVPDYTVGAGDYNTHMPLDILLGDRMGAATVILGGQLKSTLSGKTSVALNDTYYANNKSGTKYEGLSENNVCHGKPVVEPKQKSTKKVVINQPTSTTVPNWMGENNISQKNGPWGWHKIDQTQTYVTDLLEFDSIFSKLNNVGNLLAQKAELTQNADDTSIAFSGNTLTLTYEGDEESKEVVYFTLSETDFKKYQQATYIRFEKIPKLPEIRQAIKNDASGYQDIDTAYIIVNVEYKGETRSEWDSTKKYIVVDTKDNSKQTFINGNNISNIGPDRNGIENNNDPGVTSILYNFHAADKDSVVVLVRNFQGTIFAPLSHVTDTQTLNKYGGHGHLSGALIADSFEGATEFGYRPYAGISAILYGDLTIKKLVSGANPDPSQTFEFTVELSDKTVNGVHGDMTFTNGVAKVKVKAGESKTALKLPAGATYTVTESNNPDFSQTGTINEQGKIEAGRATVAEFTNTHKLGDLSVIKTVTGRGADTDQEFTFTVKVAGAKGNYSMKVSLTSDTSDAAIVGTPTKVTFDDDGEATITIKGGQKATIRGLPAGHAYTIEEKPAADYLLSQVKILGKGIVGENAQGTIAADAAQEAEFINAFIEKIGDLSIIKTVEGRGADPNQEFTFSVTVKGVIGDYDMTVSEAGAEPITRKVAFDQDGKATVSIKGGQKATISGLPADAEFTVTEDDTPGYRSGVVGKNTGTIVEKETQEVAFLNTFLTGSLIVRKTVEGEGADKTKEFSFTVELSDKTINGEYGEMNFADGAATFTLKDGETKEATDLPAGITYTVTEEDYTDDGYTVDDRIVRGKVPAGDSDEVAYVNTKTSGDDETEEVGNLIVRKTVEGEGADKTKEFSFTVELSDKTINGEYGEMDFANGAATFTLKDGETKEATDLPAGITYTVTEEDYTNEGYTVDERIVKGDIPVGKADEVTYVNTKVAEDETEEVGSLIVRKTVEGDGADLNRGFSFTVTLDAPLTGTYGEMNFTNGTARFVLAHGASKTAEDLPAGITYTVEEAPYDDYKTNMPTVSGKIPAGGAAEAAFLNRKVEEAEEDEEEATLTVTKSVRGTGADLGKAFEFTVTLSESLTGTYGEMTFTNGAARFTLRNGEKKTATGLPVGVTYTVAEETYANYKCEKSGETGLTSVEGATASFINTYSLTDWDVEGDETETVTGDLIVTKSVTGEGADKNRAFMFKVSLSKRVTQKYGDMSFVNGVATFTLKDGESKRATGLPADIIYTVVEENAEDYVTTKTGDTGTITAGQSVKAVFINAYVADTSTDVPKTGDAFPLSIWLGLMIISLAGLYLARTSMNRSKKN